MVSVSGCTESALETLTDVTNEFYLQMTSLLRSAADRNAMNGHVGFPVFIFVYLLA